MSQQEHSHQFIAWCRKYFGEDADEAYLADAIKNLPEAQPVAQSLTDVLNAVEAHSDELDDLAKRRAT